MPCMRFTNLRSPCLGVRDSSSMELPSHSTCWLSTCLNIANEKMEMITPVSTRKFTFGGEKMEMTTPVITTRRLKIWNFGIRCQLLVPMVEDIGLQFRFHC